MKGKRHAAQALTIKLFGLLDATSRGCVDEKAQKLLAGKSPALEQLNLCFMMAGDPGKEKLSEFESLAKHILSRQKDVDPSRITKLEIGQTMGVSKGSTNKIIERIDVHVRELKPSEVLNLCKGFDKEYNRRFWENQIYLAFPELRVEDETDSIEMTCLQAVWESLPDGLRSTARSTFLSHKSWLDQLEKESQEKSSSESPRLYDILEEAYQNAKKKNIVKNKEEIYDHFTIDSDTYSRYKKDWEAFEKNNCEGEFPKNRLSRERLLYLAVLLEMDYYTAFGMLAQAGYAFHFSKMDGTVSNYLLKRGCSKEEALKSLHPILKK